MTSTERRERYQNYIGGKFVDASDGRTFGSLDPYAGQPWADIPEGTVDDIDHAVAAARMWRKPCTTVELHHVPSNTVARHRHTPESLQRKVAEAESIASDLRRADAEYADVGADSPRFAPRPSALCSWCDFRAHCPEGQAQGPEKSDWAGLVTTD